MGSPVVDSFRRSENRFLKPINNLEYFEAVAKLFNSRIRSSGRIRIQGLAMETTEGGISYTKFKFQKKRLSFG